MQIPNSNDQRLDPMLGLTVAKIVQAIVFLRGSCCLLQKNNKVKLKIPKAKKENEMFKMKMK
jgi:hypothetical protein